MSPWKHEPLQKVWPTTAPLELTPAALLVEDAPFNVPTSVITPPEYRNAWVNPPMVDEPATTPLELMYAAVLMVPLAVPLNVPKSLKTPEINVKAWVVALSGV